MFSIINLISFIFIINLTNFLSANISDDVIVDISNGKIRGKYVENYYSFESIPYAEPPIGENRFEPPKPFKNNWYNNIRNATESHSACMQWDHFHYDDNNKLIGDEDCLYLDIFTPNIYGNDIYPVIVLIHGGAFMFGSALGNWLRHDLIMKYENCVVVFFNYRLGPLGFLSTGDDKIAGNMGLKDQRLALIWIKENILAFNGNPNNILLSGFSAGGASVHLQMLSPGIDNLISSAISFSGTALCPWVIVPKETMLERTSELALLLNCPTYDSNEMTKCLKLKPAEDIVKAVGNFQKFQYNPFRVFGPVIESKSVENSFISDEPEQLIKNNLTSKIPWIVALTSGEGGYNAADLMRTNENGDEIYFEQFLENFNQLAPIALFYEETLMESGAEKYSNYLKDNYQLLSSENNTNLEKYLIIQQIFSDELFNRGILKTIKLHKDYTDTPVYSYLYDNPAPFGAGNIMANRTDIKFGAVHGDDVFLIFNLPSRDKYAFRPDEEIISKKFIDMIVDFATSKKPKFGDFEIPKNERDSDKVSYLKISTNKTSIVIEDFKLLN